MKLLFLNTNIGYGGASKMIVTIANYFADAGHEVYFLTYRDTECHQTLSKNVCLIQESIEGYSNKLLGFWRTVRFVRHVIQSQMIDVSVAFLSPSQLRLSIAAVGTKTKLVFSQRGDPYYRYSSLFYRIINPIVDYFFSRADGYVFQTNGARDFYSNSIRSRSIVIPNPIDPIVRTKSRVDGIEKRIVSVARLQIWQKRQDLLIEAFKLLGDVSQEYTLDLYGDGQDESRLKSLAEGNPHIRFMGKISNVGDKIQNAAIFVLSSDFEGIPNSLLEAMSLGIPCISTDCSPGGAAMLIDNRHNGLLVPRGDAEALSNAIRFFIENPEEAEIMGNNARVVNSYILRQLFFQSGKHFLLNYANKIIIKSTSIQKIF